MRVTATVLGVAWGTFSVVGLGAFGTGLEEHMGERAAGMGEGIAIVWPGRTTKPWQGVPEGRFLRLRSEQVRALRHQVPGLARISPEHSRYERVRRGQDAYRPQLTGVDPEYAALRNLEPRPGGRFLNRRDLEERRRVLFLGDRVARQLFGDVDPVGRTLVLAERPFTVVGVMASKYQESDYGELDEARAFIPISTYERLFGDRWVDDFVVQATHPDRLPAVLDGIYAALARTLGFDPRDRLALGVWDTTEGDRIRAMAFDGMALLTMLAGAFTVLVGAIGVGNLMFLLVRRRRVEIGLRLALGARPRWVMRRVLGEALAFIAAGGAIGFLAAAGVAVLVGASPLSADLGEPRISPTLALGTWTLLALVGLVAGWFPARRAARLDPATVLAEGA